MKVLCAVLLLLIFTAHGYAQDYTLRKDVLSNGGSPSSSPNIRISSTIGQSMAGNSSSSGFMVKSGFWPGGGMLGGPCDYIIGDVNGSESYNGLDITYGVAFFKGGPGPQYECECGQYGTWFVSGDVNASCSYNGLDITYGVAYFKGGAGPAPCGDCPPAGIMAASAEKSDKTQLIPGVLPGSKTHQKNKNEGIFQARQK